MDKAQVIREFLEWAEAEHDVVLAWDDQGEAWEINKKTKNALVNEFVASPEQASADETVCMNGWPWKKAPKYPAPLHEEPTTYYISPEWTPTAETVRQWKEAWGEKAKC